MFNLPFKSLRHFWRINAAVVLGMIVGTAVLAGALIVGDSVRGSLREMTLVRLGAVDHALVANRFFREALAEDLQTAPAFEGEFSEAVPAVALTGSLENPGTGDFSRGINLYGVDGRFWQLDRWLSTEGDAQAEVRQALDDLEGRSIVLNQSAAHAIGAEPGDSVLLRLEKPDPIPSEAVHGRRLGQTVTLRLEIAAVLPNDGFGRFGLLPSQQLPLNAYVPLDTLQQLLELGDSVNMILVSETGAGPRIATDADTDPSSRLQAALQEVVELHDMDLKIVPHDDFLSLESLRLVLRKVDAVGAEQFARAHGIRYEPTLTYLANSMSNGRGEVSYATVSALDPAAEPPLGPLFLIDGTPAPPLAPDEIYLNEWAAEDMDARVGDPIRMTFYTSGPEGEFLDDGAADFRLAGITAIRGLGAETGLTPEYPGISDATSIRDWDPPFPVDLDRVTERDEQYWEQYGALPKAFVNLERGAELWTSRFGQFTSMRMTAAPGLTLEETRGLLERGLPDTIHATNAGLVFSPVKAEGLEASKGATDFGSLFIGFSLFIIVSAMLLVRLLFSLGVEFRIREVGLLLASGFPAKRVRNLLLTEGVVLAAIGATIGVVAGVGFAALMLYGLRTWWVGSVGTTFLTLHVGTLSVIGGWLAGFLAGVASVYFAVRTLTKAEPVELLSGRQRSSSRLATSQLNARRRKRELQLAGALFALALACVAASGFAGSSAQAGLFFGGGALLLLAGLAFVSSYLRAPQTGLAQGGRTAPLLRLGSRNAARHHARSLLTIGIVSSATLIIVAVAAFRHGEIESPLDRNSGTGGYPLLARSDAPVLKNLNDPDARADFGFSPASSEAAAEATIYPLRSSPGEEASCLNLYRPGRPRLLGAPEEFIERGGFAFQGSLAETEEEKANPWLLLNREFPDGAVPAIGDYNTVMWILHSGLGEVVLSETDVGEPVALRIVGLLKGSALQSELIVSEEDFIDLYPEHGGYNFFFIDAPEEEIIEVARALETSLRPYGFDAMETVERIESYHAVENTYLSTFQALGGLGLLLGTLGLATVMLRNIVERRAELGLLRAVGYSPRSLAVLVLAENGFLLVIGLAIGVVAALLAVAPALGGAGSDIEWISLLATLALILVVGMAAGGIAVWAAIRAPVIEALRSE